VSGKEDRCEACGIAKYLHAHHMDGNPANNRRENIQTLCVYCHKYLHAMADRLGWKEPGRMPFFEQRVAGLVKIVSLVSKL
jgi:hypothetical protein